MDKMVYNESVVNGRINIDNLLKCICKLNRRQQGKKERNKRPETLGLAFGCVRI